MYAFNHDGEDDNDLDPDEVMAALEVDWTNDSGGDGDVDEVDFKDSVFELAVTWAKQLNGGDGGGTKREEKAGKQRTKKKGNGLKRNKAGRNGGEASSISLPKASDLVVYLQNLYVLVFDTFAGMKVSLDVVYMHNLNNSCVLYRKK